MHPTLLRVRPAVVEIHMQPNWLAVGCVFALVQGCSSTEPPTPEPMPDASNIVDSSVHPQADGALQDATVADATDTGAAHDVTTFADGNTCIPACTDGFDCTATGCFRGCFMDSDCAQIPGTTCSSHIVCEKPPPCDMDCSTVCYGHCKPGGPDE
jgi:hypothetical protein